MGSTSPPAALRGRHRPLPLPLLPASFPSPSISRRRDPATVASRSSMCALRSNQRSASLCCLAPRLSSSLLFAPISSSPDGGQSSPASRGSRRRRPPSPRSTAGRDPPLPRLPLPHDPPLGRAHLQSQRLPSTTSRTSSHSGSLVPLVVHDLLHRASPACSLQGPALPLSMGRLQPNSSKADKTC